MAVHFFSIYRLTKRIRANMATHTINSTLRANLNRKFQYQTTAFKLFLQTTTAIVTCLCDVEKREATAVSSPPKHFKDTYAPCQDR